VGSAEELWRVWTDLPLLTKDVLRDRFAPERLFNECRVRGRLDCTGGSTGEPLRFVHDRNMIRAKRAAHMYTRLRMGWRPGMATIILWGSDRDIGRGVPLYSRVWRRAVRDFIIAGFAVDERVVERVVRILDVCRPVAIYGYTSFLEWLAKASLAAGVAPRAGDVAVAWNGGEVLAPEQSDIFRRAFGVPILNRYGCRELSIIACQYAPTGPLWVLRPLVFLEVVDDLGRPAGPNQLGRLICTSTICRGTPFLRYVIGDLGTYGPQDRDQSGIVALRTVQGRVSGCIPTLDGKVLSSIFWNHLFKDYPWIQQFQVRWSPTRIRILFRGEPLPASVEQETIHKVQRVVGPIPTSLERVDRLALTPEGKLIHVVREG